jgi:SAM-dependent methyltransferase
MVEQSQQEFDEYASRYEAVIDEYISFSGQSQDFYTRVKAEHLHRILDTKGAGSELDVLDIGCGHGLIHRYMHDPQYRLTGIDVAEKALRRAQDGNPHVNYDLYDGLRLPYPDETFDVAFTICVLHHVPVDQRAVFISEARRVLRCGGMFVIFEHNKLNPLVQWVVSRIPFDRNAILLTSWQAEKLVRNASFREIYSNYILVFPFDAAPFRKIESYLRRLPLGAQYYTTAVK